MPSGIYKHKNHSEETKMKIALGHQGKFKGDSIKYSGLHEWVKRNLGTPSTCENCSQSDLFGHNIHWANKSRQYKKDLNDWLRLCALCHKRYDLGRINCG